MTSPYSVISVSSNALGSLPLIACVLVLRATALIIAGLEVVFTYGGGPNVRGRYPNCKIGERYRY